ncbi:MAG: ABC transporter permease [Opitutales bacterium]|jgi:ABC-2 type transport system permease protein
MKGMWAIVLLDVKRFWLDRVRLATGLIQPLLYLFVLGAGLGASFQHGGHAYQKFIFPGVIALALMFTATFAAIYIVFDRQVGFFKAVLVSPVSRPAIAVGKVVAGALQAMTQGVVLLVFAPLAGVSLGFMEVVGMLAAMLLASLTFSAIGVGLAARFTSTTVFPVMSNAVLLPMFFISGAMFPLTAAPAWLRGLAHLDPVAYAVDLMRQALLGSGPDVAFFPAWLDVAVLVGVTGALTWAAVAVFMRGEEVSLGASPFPWRR